LTNFGADEQFMRVIVAFLLMSIAIGLANIEAIAADHPGKVALVIGNAKYPDNDAVLNDAANDAQDVADELKSDGFDVEKGINLTGDAMRQALGRFYTRIQEQGGVALIFFSGFGVQASRQTYLLPVDAQIWIEGDVVRDGLNLETILDQMNSHGAAYKVALLDASRRNPFERRFRRSSEGLAPAFTPINSLVLYSSALGSVVTTSRNDHSLFVTELIREMRVPSVTGEQVLRNTQAGVISATKEEQVPWLSSSLTTAFSFSGPVPSVADKRKDTTPPGDKVPPDQPKLCVSPQPYPAPSQEELADDPTIKELTRNIAANRNDQDSYFKRGRTYAIKRAYALAVSDFDEVIKQHPDSETYNNRCWTRAALGDLDGALKDCDEALRLKPGLGIALDSRGLVDLKLGKYSDAIRDYSASIDTDQRSVSSLFGRGLATMRNGGDGSFDLKLAKSMDSNIGREFASYGVNECDR
jgi:hypothetical protein